MLPAIGLGWDAIMMNIDEKPLKVYVVDAGSTGSRVYRYTATDFSGTHVVGAGPQGGEQRELDGAPLWVLAPSNKPSERVPAADADPSSAF